MVGLVLILALLVFSGAWSAEILHPLEERSEAVHHRHQREYLEGPHFHEAHFCIHLQNLAPAIDPLEPKPIEGTFLPSVEGPSEVDSTHPLSRRSRAPPLPARS